MDLGKKTVREILEKQIGKEHTGDVLDKVNQAFNEGKRGDELIDLFKDSLTEKGLDASDSSYGCVIAFA